MNQNGGGQQVVLRSVEDLRGVANPASLRSIRIEADLDATLEIVASTTNAMADLYLEVPALNSTDQLDHALQAIATQFPILTRIVVDIISAPPEQSWLKVSALGLFDHLEHLVVRCPMPLLLTNEDLQGMIRGWPLIRHLELNPMGNTAFYGIQDRLPSLGGVIAAAECGTYLEYLGLCIKPELQIPQVFLSWKKLKYMDFGRSSGSDADANKVARILHQAFPPAEYPDLKMVTYIGQSAWVQLLAARFEQLRGNLS
ncbi:hypothetical protein PUNSTDRAFT_131201 [Punctularia strigosozonata HHB-11173 SS5]|uniref:uncharacterized protein n=1 Tax=Punctularia strigosozonata (strain HHB-11173) TaxID=741275 RepID=UPI00044184AD|nr:uncharacterized protein PUNSTDRAFT_131201 [Punctularia strigosozonata HHB-11173 SS5]EIN12971.1 hypothetical protein PUNSTDRAFT_131201 [Punctularia strigosozonata HHB-11173 SS5]